MPKITTVMFLCLASKFSVGQKILGGQESKIQLTTATLTTPIKAPDTDGVSFDISARRTNPINEAIEIKATLFNNNNDTIYFLTSTCEGDQYSLRYDTSKFILTPSIYCNASYPKLQKIAPKGQYGFLAYFRCSSKETKINFGFDFYSVDKSIDLSQINLGKIHNRPTTEQNVLWAGEKTIK